MLLIGLANGTSSQLNAYLFGSISTVSSSDVWSICLLALVIVAIGIGLLPALYSVTNDEEFARSTGLPVRALTMLIAILSALTVVVAMRIVGSLLVSALMVVPVAIAQLGAHSFRRTMAYAMVLGALLCLGGLTLTYYIDLSPVQRLLWPQSLSMLLATESEGCVITSVASSECVNYPRPRNIPRPRQEIAGTPPPRAGREKTTHHRPRQ